MHKPERIYEYEGAPDAFVDFGYSTDTVAYGRGDMVEGYETSVEITHIDGIEVWGPCSIIFEYDKPELAATDIPAMEQWIREHDL